MPEKSLRIAVVGAGTLLGKALTDELAASAFASADFHLVDDEEALGKLAATADEVTFIQRIEPDSFDGCDFTFFAGSPELTRKHWRKALDAGSSIVDLSGELEGASGILVRAPWIQDDPAAMDHAAQESQVPAPDLQTRAVVSAHPVAVLLALLTARSQRIAALHNVWATLLQPASEYGHAALEELHQQTTNLLSFQPLPTEVFGGQTAFTLAVSFGTEGRVPLSTVAEVVRRHYAKIASAPAAPLALQVIQVPVFHGYALSVAVEFQTPITVDALAQALAGPHVHVITDASEFPGNVQAVEEDDVQVLVQAVTEEAGVPGLQRPAKQHLDAQKTHRFWLWIVADNLKFAAQNAVACAVELNRLRPRGSVQ
jgi:aspartate-semialdehyde dehydrogenase